MTPHYSDDWLTVYGGDCREVLASLPSDSVDCVVTRPPYWGLRDYGTATWVGGDEGCNHRIGRVMGNANKGHVRDVLDGDRSRCECGATRIDSQLGLERTPEEYVANMVAVFREVRRVLKPSGTCWLNLGDSYFGTGRGPSNDHKPAGLHSNVTERGEFPMRGVYIHDTLKGKDLVGIPWRVAFALQADGWYLRSDIIWSKPNPMPESVTDRPTKSHEYLFLLTKSARYYFDADAVREPHKWQDVAELAVNAQARQQKRNHEAGRIVGQSEAHPVNDGREKRGRYTLGIGERNLSQSEAGRNIRSVWTIATRPCPGAHFAVFPPELPERCIKAGSSERGVCPECGAPWERVVERTAMVVRPGPGRAPLMNAATGATSRTAVTGTMLSPAPSTTIGWRNSCAHSGIADPIPAVVLDPFAGSGTVGLVANRLSRRAILIDLNPAHLEQQMRRNAQTPLGLTEGDAA